MSVSPYQLGIKCVFADKNIDPPNFDLSERNRRFIQLTTAKSSEVISEVLQKHGLNKIIEVFSNNLLKSVRKGFLEEEKIYLIKFNGYYISPVMGHK